MKKIAALLLSAVLALSLAAPVMAEGFISSVTRRSASEALQGTTGEDGETHYGSITSSSGDVTYVEKGGILVLGEDGSSSVSYDDLDEGDQALWDVAKTRLQAAYEAILGADSLQSLLGTEVLSADGHYEVLDLFDVSLLGSYYQDARDALEAGGTVTMVFDIGAEPGAVVYVYVYGEDGRWHYMEAANLGDGTVQVVLTELGTLAFIVDTDTVSGGVYGTGTSGTGTSGTGTSGTGASGEEGTVTSPQTSDDLSPLYAAGTVILLAGAAVCLALSRRRYPER